MSLVDFKAVKDTVVTLDNGSWLGGLIRGSVNSNKTENVQAILICSKGSNPAFVPFDIEIKEVFLLS